MTTRPSPVTSERMIKAAASMRRQKRSRRAASPTAINTPKPIFFTVQELSSTSDGKRLRPNMHTCGPPAGLADSHSSHTDTPNSRPPGPQAQAACVIMPSG